jgi:hypothetical protein
MLESYAEHDLYTLADAQLIVESQNIQRMLCPLEKAAQPVLEPEGAFEGVGAPGHWETYTAQDGFHFGSILYDPDLALFRYWYHPAGRLSGVFDRTSLLPPVTARAIAYATSPDGLAWERPALGRVHHPLGGVPNLAVMAEPPVRTAINASIVPLDRTFAPQRFAACYWATCDDDLYPRGIAISVSEDGLHWQPGYPPVLPLDGDRCAMMWDAHRREFLITTRSSQHRNLAQRWGRPWKRHIALARSRDLQYWTPLHTVLEADEDDPADVELYSMYIVAYGHGYLGFLEIFHTESALLENQLAFSRDLTTWQRAQGRGPAGRGDRSPFLARGDTGAWDSAHICLTMNPPHLEKDQLRFWYGGKAAPHWQAGYAALGTATLRRDGFVAAKAGDEPGTLTTIPFRSRGRCWLYLNVEASNGEVRVEALDEAGQPIPGADLAACQPITGDHIRGLVTFHDGHNAIGHDGLLRLRFHLRNATLYAFKLQQAEPVWPALDSRI